MQELHQHDVLHSLAKGRYAIIVAQARAETVDEAQDPFERLLEAVDQLVVYWSEITPRLPADTRHGIDV